jgi:hypothetical protein
MLAHGHILTRRREVAELFRQQVCVIHGRDLKDGVCNHISQLLIGCVDRFKQQRNGRDRICSEGPKNTCSTHFLLEIGRDQTQIEFKFKSAQRFRGSGCNQRILVVPCSLQKWNGRTSMVAHHRQTFCSSPTERFIFVGQCIHEDGHSFCTESCKNVTGSILGVPTRAFKNLRQFRNSAWNFRREHDESERCFISTLKQRVGHFPFFSGSSVDCIKDVTSQRFLLAQFVFVIDPFQEVWNSARSDGFDRVFGFFRPGFVLGMEIDRFPISLNPGRKRSALVKGAFGASLDRNECNQCYRNNPARNQKTFFASIQHDGNFATEERT